MPLKDLPADARPREKLLARGAAALSDAELLALLLRTGIEGKNVVALAQEIVDRFGGISGLLHTDAASLKNIKGLGPAKQAELLAVLELSRRALAEQMMHKTVFDSPSSLLDFVRLKIGGKPYECFMVIFVDATQKLIASEELFRGTLTAAAVYPREVALRALHHHAAGVILAHNHPSGEVQPSYADQSLTSKLQAALGLLDIAVLDHVIVSRDKALSMHAQGLL
ncbi:DNA repair protein RadC [Variovorax sp. PCZ-1]|uniref:RadC family protein n=1 Tax=Variovorax sp. PCZ-1 TaxID=2835533 RepID=UPI001BCB500F|nr:DNA repair protein RadC [Variovorax sp. PCZ-1]MBS7807099.1 DNA repair protein RadC [Variovorax sp. PCZ-1]